jgi:hypothetical protein
MLPWLLAAVVLLAGCGSKATASRTSSADWAESVCTALTTWKTSIDSAAESLRAGTISITALQSASDQVNSANRNLAGTLANVGKPNTSAAGPAKQSLDRFVAQITTEQDRISTAVNEAWSSVPLPNAITTASPVVLGSLEALGTEVSETFNRLQTLDAPGELSSAFNQAGSCQALKPSS